VQDKCYFEAVVVHSTNRQVTLSVGVLGKEVKRGLNFMEVTCYYSWLLGWWWCLLWLMFYYDQRWCSLSRFILFTLALAHCFSFVSFFFWCVFVRACMCFMLYCVGLSRINAKFLLRRVEICSSCRRSTSEASLSNWKCPSRKEFELLPLRS
jgi:hypothetical protein